MRALRRQADPSDRLDQQARRVDEDSVVRDERHPKAEGGRRDPTIGVVVPLTQRMASPDALCSKSGVDLDQFGP